MNCSRWCLPERARQPTVNSECHYAASTDTGTKSHKPAWCTTQDIYSCIGVVQIKFTPSFRNIWGPRCQVSAVLMCERHMRAKIWWNSNYTMCGEQWAKEVSEWGDIPRINLQNNTKFTEETNKWGFWVFRNSRNRLVYFKNAHPSGCTNWQFRSVLRR